MMELRHLRYFVLVAEELHFGRAAERAGIAQPPLSQQIRALEADLGVRLFDRTNRSVRLTSAGESLLPQARRLLEDARQAREDTQAVAAGNRGRLRIAFVGSLVLSLLPRFVERWRAEYPDVRLDVSELTSDQQRVALLERRIDLGIGRYPLDEQELVSDQLRSERLLIALPEGHRRENGALPASIADIAGLPLIIFPRHLGPPLYDQIVGLFRNEGIDPVIGQEAIQMLTIVALVSAGAGCAIVPASLEKTGMPGVTFHQIAGVDDSLAHTGQYATYRAVDDSATIRNALETVKSI